MIELSCHNVSMAYDKTVVKNATFSVERGDFVCIVGENGSGKTTLVKGILGLLPVSSGKISFCGNNRIGYVPQQTPVQKDFPAGVFEVVLSGCLPSKGILPFYNANDKRLAEEKMKEMGIENLRNKCYRELSGGQQQRVLLARALCAAETMLVLDEPVTGLDPHATEELYNILTKQNKKHNMTILMVSHDIKSALKVGNKILHMDGEILFFGSTDEYIKSSFGKKYLS